jgi:hypothetical protein
LFGKSGADSARQEGKAMPSISTANNPKNFVFKIMKHSVSSCFLL